MLAVFDLDHTLIKENITFAFTKHLYKKRILSKIDMLHVFWTYFLFQLFLISIERVHQRSFKRLIKGKDKRLIEDETKAFLDEKLEFLMRPNILKLLRDAQHQDHHTLLLSSSPDFLVMPIANRLKFSQCEASHYQVDNNFLFCDISRLIQGKEKAKFVAQLTASLGFSPKQTIAYTDSWHDVPLLNIVGTPVVVYPDKRLRKIAESKNWKLIE